ncbi:hypothetical protein [Saccharopolyspora sp. CA-218241]
MIPFRGGARFDFFVEQSSGWWWKKRTRAEVQQAVMNSFQLGAAIA